MSDADRTPDVTPAEGAPTEAVDDEVKQAATEANEKADPATDAEDDGTEDADA